MALLTGFSLRELLLHSALLALYTYYLYYPYEYLYARGTAPESLTGGRLVKLIRTISIDWIPHLLFWVLHRRSIQLCCRQFTSGGGPISPFFISICPMRVAGCS